MLLYSKDYNIIDFGAIGDGKTINTTYIQSAIDAAATKGGGRVIIPSGRFLSSSILLKSDVELHLLKDAVLMGVVSQDNYIKIAFWRALIQADGQKNVSISGEGEINGQGRKIGLYLDSLFYEGKVDSSQYNFIEKRPRFSLRPLIVQFVKCNNVKVTAFIDDFYYQARNIADKLNKKGGIQILQTSDKSEFLIKLDLDFENLF